MRIVVDGRLALADGGGTSSEQDVATAFGLGSERDSPVVRVAADLGTAELAASGFWLHEQGSGVLSQPFGGLAAGTAVDTDLDLGVAKLTAAFAIELGGATIAPGLLVDVFAIDFRASESPGNREEVDEIVAVPLPYVRAAVPFGRWRADAELAWLDARVFGADGEFADVEAKVAWRVAERVELIAGHRFLMADAEGGSETDAVGIDLTLRGWFVGGGIRF